jgi:hypothetical protein
MQPNYKSDQDLISRDHCLAIGRKRENELRRAGTVGGAIALLIGFFIGYLIGKRSDCPDKCHIPTLQEMPKLVSPEQPAQSK